MSIERVGELLPGGTVGVVALDQVEVLHQPIDHGWVGILDRLDDRRAGVLAERLVGPVAAGHADHRELELTVPFEVVERREQLALGEIAGGAEQHQRVGGRLIGT